jgi:colanic acid/amylovoran biosynthesis glycosyltransferase
MGEKMKIAYLAPEIPALSATFVYNEILGLEARGYEVLPISVHHPDAPALEPAVKGIRSRTIYLYQMPFWRVAASFFRMFAARPLSATRTGMMVLGDAGRMGLQSHVGRGLIYRSLAGAQVARILLREGCGHLHTHFAHVPADIAMYASALSGIPFSFTAHANDLFERGWLLKEKVRRASVAVTISEYNRRFFLEQGADPAKIRIVRCGVDTTLTQADPPGEPNDPPVIGSLGRLVEKKGFDTLIEALSRRRRAGIRFRLEIAGDGPLMDSLRQMAESEGIAAEITFLGAMSHDRVFDWLKRLDLFVLACRKDRNGDQDGIPVVLMEAMTTGTPVVSTRISGIPELIIDGKTGMLADPGDPESLARAIRAVLDDPELTAKIVTGARQHVQKDFDTEVNLDRLIRCFERGA